MADFDELRRLKDGDFIRIDGRLYTKSGRNLVRVEDRPEVPRSTPDPRDSLRSRDQNVHSSSQPRLPSQRSYDYREPRGYSNEAREARTLVDEQPSRTERRPRDSRESEVRRNPRIADNDSQYSENSKPERLPAQHEAADSPASNPGRQYTISSSRDTIEEDFEEEPVSRRQLDTNPKQSKSPRAVVRDQPSRKVYPTDDDIETEEEADIVGEDLKYVTGITRFFIGIPFNDFLERAEFVNENSELLASDLGIYHREAVWQKSQGRSRRARQCIQSLALLHSWKDQNRKEILKQAKALADPRSREADIHRRNYEKFEAAMNKEVSDRTNRDIARGFPAFPTVDRPPAQTSRLQSTIAQPNTQGVYSDPRKPSNQSQSHRQLSDTARLTTTRTDLTTLNMEDTEQFADEEEFGQDLRTNRVLDEISKIASKSPPFQTIPPEKFGGEDAREMKALSSLYQVPKNAKKFFEVGRVFSVLWSQPAGQPHRPNSTKAIDPSEDPVPADRLPYNVTYGPHGQRIFSQIRRMVVVRNREGYCWCISISTYGGRGLNKTGLKQSEINAHAIVYDSKKPPKYLKGEPSTTKRPIAVDVVPGQHLDVASRLHFAKPFSVEWNTSVMNVGMVAKDSLSSLLNDVANELLGGQSRGQE